MLSKRRVKVQSLCRFISFFGRKKPSTNKDDENCTFDIKSCFSNNKSSNLKITDSCSLKDCCSIPKVIVIGAGLAGLSAAGRLINAGVEEIAILEGTNRVGGRIMSAWVGDAMIELGPTVINGASLANPLYNLANLASAVSYPVKRLTKNKKVFLASDGNLITDYGVESLLFHQLLSDAMGKKNKKPSDCSCHPTCNLMQYLGLRAQQELLHLPVEMQSKAEKVLWGMINSMRTYFGADPSKISASALSSKTQTPGGSIVLEGGMLRILAPLIQNIPENHLILSSPVDKVILNPCPKPKNAVKVITCDGKEYEADYVISTLPIGVLKKRGREMFKGALTKEQINAIDNIGIGLMNHVYLEYAHPWWIPGISDMMLAWSMVELQTTNEWTKGIAYIHEVPGSKHLLSVEIAGPEAELIENVAEEEVAIQVTRFFRKFTGDTSIPYPSNIVVSRWNCDPFFHGSTVFMGLNTTPGMFRDLGGNSCDTYTGPPVPPIIFAGDATIPEYYGSLEGARRSGIRAANKIITSTKIKCDEESKRENEEQESEDECCEQDAQQSR